MDTQPLPVLFVFPPLPGSGRNHWTEDVSREEVQVHRFLNSEVTRKGGLGFQVAFPQGKVTPITLEEFSGLGVAG